MIRSPHMQDEHAHAHPRQEGLEESEPLSLHSTFFLSLPGLFSIPELTSLLARPNYRRAEADHFQTSCASLAVLQRYTPLRAEILSASAYVHCTRLGYLGGRQQGPLPGQAQESRNNGRLFLLAGEVAGHLPYPTARLMEQACLGRVCCCPNQNPSILYAAFLLSIQIDATGYAALMLVGRC